MSNQPLGQAAKRVFELELRGISTPRMAWHRSLYRAKTHSPAGALAQAGSNPALTTDPEPTALMQRQNKALKYQPASSGTRKKIGTKHFPN